MTNASLHHTLVSRTVGAGFTTLEKSASAQSEVGEVINNAWPTAEEGLTKTATLARILAIGAVIERADQPE